MNKSDFKNAILKRKFSLPIIIVLIIIIGVFFIQKQDYKYTLLYQYQSVPDIGLTNTLRGTQDGVFGEVRGFVKFDNLKDQPKNLKQYYIIKPLNKFDDNSSQYFSIEEIIKMQYLPPASTGISELVKTNETNNIITLEDANGNQFFINKSTKVISMKDVTGDNTTLITNDNDYSNFIKESLKN